MTSTKRLYLAPDAPAVYQDDHYLVMDKVGSESAVKILARNLFSGAIGGYVGGNIAHLTNGTSAAGQKTVTLDETTGFLPGGWAAYTLVSGVIEYNLIAAVTDGTHLLLTTDIGATGIGHNVYVGMVPNDVYWAAQAIPHAGSLTLDKTIAYSNSGAVHVKACGAVGDGTTDDQAALEVAWGKLSEGGTLVLDDGGVYAVADTVDWKGKTAITIIANNAIIKPKTGTNFSGKTVVDMRGSQYCNVSGLRIDCDLASNLPNVGLELHRTVDVVDGGANRFDNCWFSGKYAVAVVFEKGSEVTSFWNCRFVTNVAGKPCYLTTSVDAWQTAGSVSNVCKRFYACTFLDYSSTATGQVLIEAQGISKELSFRDCYCGLSGTGIVIKLSGASASFYGLFLDNIRVEGPAGANAASRLLYCGQDNALANADIRGINWTMESDYVIEIASTSAILHSVLYLNTELTGATKWLKASSTLGYNYIVTGAAETLSIDSGEYATANYVVAFGNGNPFTGAGNYEQFIYHDNIVVSLYDGASYLGAARRKVEGTVIDGHSATPSVARSSLISLQQDQATNVTNFSGMVDGQEIMLIGTNAYTTLVHGATIKLAGAANYVSVSGGTITLVYFAYATAWYEKSRMVPA